MGDGNGRRTILLVDDDDEVRSALRRGLERGGFRVVAAFDERDGVERAAYDPPDLILVELGRVPPVVALAAGRRVRTGAGLPEKVPVVAYANNEGEVAREGESVEFRPREYVVLPEDSEQLVGWLRGLTARRRAGAEGGDSPAGYGWLDLPALATVEVTSEEAAHPAGAALAGGRGGGWRASQPGEQVLRVLFDEPQRLVRILLLFEEDAQARTQEFVLRWSGEGGSPYREIVRQQYTFSPAGATREAEDYRVELDGVTALELRIVPDIGGGDARASLAQLRLK